MVSDGSNPNLILSRGQILSLLTLTGIAISAGGTWTIRQNRVSRTQPDPPAREKVVVTPETSNLPAESPAATPESQTNHEPREQLPPTNPPPSEKGTYDRRLLLGEWRDHFYGKRVFTYRDDGTGTMTVEPEDPVSRALFGEKLTFYLTWTLDGDVMHLEMAGGEPQPAADRLAQLFGRTSDRRIEYLDQHELRVRSLDSQKLYIHHR